MNRVAGLYSVPIENQGFRHEESSRVQLSSRNSSAVGKPIVFQGYKKLMTDRSRVAITLSTALMLGASTYGHAFDISLPGVLQDIWDGSEWMIYGLAVVSVFLIYRWWALLPAIAPIAVTIYLHSMTDYVSPWHESEDLSVSPLLFLLVIGGLVIQAALLSVGLLLRAVWESIRSRYRKGTLPDSA